jgi:hypothetical protein
MLPVDYEASINREYSDKYDLEAAEMYHPEIIRSVAKQPEEARTSNLIEPSVQKSEMFEPSIIREFTPENIFDDDDKHGSEEDNIMEFSPHIS